jgi:DNA-binding NarL/FixJ family response regulator
VITLPTPAPKIQVLVADTTLVSCCALAQMLQAGGQCECTSVTTSHQALRLLRQAKFDVALIAIDSAFSTTFLLDIHRMYPALGIVALSQSSERDVVVDALASGARGIFHRADSLSLLWECVRCVHAGQVWAHSAEIEYVLDILIEHAAKSEQRHGTTCLSRREEEIARLVAEGKSNRQISTLLVLSEHTIKNYLFRIFEKLNLTSRVELTLHMLGQAGSALAYPKIEDSRSFASAPLSSRKTSLRPVLAVPLRKN